MQLLLDTHTLLWWLDGNQRLPIAMRKLIVDEDNEVLVSAASAWEIATKVRIGKLPGAVLVAEQFVECLRDQGFTELAITVSHAQRAGLLPGPHRDPFDRMLMAQAQTEGIPIISNDEVFDLYKVRQIW